MLFTVLFAFVGVPSILPMVTVVYEVYSLTCFKELKFSPGTIFFVFFIVSPDGFDRDSYDFFKSFGDSFLILSSENGVFIDFL